MKTWVKKSIVIMVAFLTFGLITPTHEFGKHLIKILRTVHPSALHQGQALL